LQGIINIIKNTAIRGLLEKVKKGQKQRKKYHYWG